MEQLQNRHDLTDAQWNRIEPIIKQHLNKRGGSNANDNRVFVTACLWIVRTGSPWRDLLLNTESSMRSIADINDGVTTIFGNISLAELITEPDYEWLMIDASHCKKFTLMLVEQREETLNREDKRGAQYQDSPCGGCAWYATANSCHRVQEQIAKWHELIEGISWNT